MCLSERNTTSRGRSAVPATLRRTRRCRRRRNWMRLLGAWIGRMLLGSCLARLAADLLTLIADPLALVGLGRPHRAELRGYLPHGLLVGSLDLDHGVVLDRDLDALGRLVLDWVRVAHDQVHAVGLGLGLVAHALDLERLAEPLGDAVHHVLHQGAAQAVQRL